METNNNTKYYLIGEGAISFFENKNLALLANCFDQDDNKFVMVEEEDEMPKNAKEISYQEYLSVSGLCEVLDNIREGDIDEVDEEWFYENIEKVAELSGKEYNPFDVVEMIND